MASRRDDPASVVVCAILQKISRLEATDGVAAENETVVSGITAVLEEAAAGAEQAAAEGRAATKGESDAMAYALHACARADANPECMTARVRKALVGGDGVGAVGRRADLMRALPMSRVVRAAQRGLGQLLLALQAEALESLNQKTVRLLLRLLKHEELLRRGDKPEFEEEEAEAVEVEAMEAEAMEAEAMEAEAEVGGDGRLPLSMAELEVALAAVPAVAALLPAGSALGSELGRLTRWLNDVLALGEFLRAAREAHEVSSPQCQMTEASKANATALREALLGQLTKARLLLRARRACFLLRARRVTPRTGPCPRQLLGRSGLRTAGRVPAAVAAGRVHLHERAPVGCGHVGAARRTLCGPLLNFSDELPAFEAVVGSWVSLEELSPGLDNSTGNSTGT
jgi:hypothetical protein